MDPANNTSEIATSRVPELIGLSVAQVHTLTVEYGLQDIIDIAGLQLADIDQILGNESNTFVQRRRLAALATYLQKGGTITPQTTKADFLRTTVTPIATVLPPPPAPDSERRSSPTKFSLQDFPTFGGELEEIHDFKISVEEIIVTSSYKFLLERDAMTAEEKERDVEFFNILKLSFMKGKVSHLVDASYVNAADGTILPFSGRKLWLDFLGWTTAGGRKDKYVNQIKNELKNLKLDGDVTDGPVSVTYITNCCLSYYWCWCYFWCWCWWCPCTKQSKEEEEDGPNRSAH